MTSPDTDRDPVDLLAEEFVARLRRGERPSVSDYAAKYPAHAEQLRDLLPAVAQMEQLKRFRQAAPAAPRLPDRLGDFRIVRELGRGGMGVVFEAVQESLGRRVALKLLAGHWLTDRAKRGRFVREAHAAARLHHTNIVPVFGVGDQDGLPYYVMQLIPGRGLNDVVRDWQQPAGAATRSTLNAARAATTSVPPDPTPPPAPPPAAGPRYGDWAFVAAVGLQAADALRYAHDHGVLHRDVKPANLILDTQGEAWVADFGLAKTADGGTITGTGEVLGTLQYLAPECLHGTADGRSDVYGLGATLYELLTLAPPVDGDTPAALLKQIGEKDPVPPRAVNPAVPRDLETIVLKAIAREPNHRYASPAELADDLRAFLEDRPIRARRTSALARGWRWCRRNPAVAGLSGTTAAALVLAAAVGWAAYVQTDAALAKERAARASETAALASETEALRKEADRRAEAERVSARLGENLDLSLDAFERIFEATMAADGRPGFGRGPGGPGPGGGDVFDRAAVLESVVAFYDRFAEKNDTNTKLQFEAARAHRRVAEMNQILGRGDRSAASFRRAADLLTRLRERFADDERVRYELLLTFAHAPKETFGAGGWAGLERTLAGVAEEERATGAKRPGLAEVYARLAWVREELADPDGAYQAYRAAVAGLPPDARAPERLSERVRVRAAFADFLLRTDRPDEARKVLGEAAGELRSPVGLSLVFSRGLREQFAALYDRLAETAEEAGDRRAADADKRAAAGFRWNLFDPAGRGGHGPDPKGPGGPGGRPKEKEKEREREKDGPRRPGGPA